MCGECSPRMDHTGFITAQGGMYCPGPPCSGSRVPCKCTVSSELCFSCSSQVSAARVLRCSARAQTLMGCAFGALPRSKQLRQQVLGEHYPKWTSHFMHLPSPNRLVSQVCHLSPLGRWSQAATLRADVSRPESQEYMVSNWEPTYNLVEDAVSGAEIVAAPWFVALAVDHLLLCHWGRRALYGSWLMLLWYSLNSLFHLQKSFISFLSFFFFFFFFCLCHPMLEWLYHISSLILSSGHSARSLL